MKILPQHWAIHLSYLDSRGDGKPRQYRQNARVGISALTLQQAVQAAESHGVPDYAYDVEIHSANPCGTLNLLVTKDGVFDPMFPMATKAVI